MSPSYQIPDLLSLSRSFELRTNRSCHYVTTASEASLLNLKKTTDVNLNVLTITEMTALRPTKAGLLAALCFADCDLPQLKFLTDFITILILSAGRRHLTRSLDESAWRGGNDESGIDCLGHHELFQ